MTTIQKEVDVLFEQQGFEDGGSCRNPVTGAGFMALGEGRDDLACQKQEACAALVAQEWSRQVNPEMPDLLVDPCDIERAMRSLSKEEELFGYYARSIYCGNYKVVGHPNFSTFARGALAHPDCPDHLHNDPALRAIYPPKHMPRMRSGLVFDC